MLLLINEVSCCFYSMRCRVVLFQRCLIYFSDRHLAPMILINGVSCVPVVGTQDWCASSKDVSWTGCLHAGPVIWENPGYVSPNDLRAAAKRQDAGKYSNKVAKRAARRVHKAENAIPKGELEGLFK